MIYIDSKNKYAKDITLIINKYIKENKITEFYDVMCGGANITDKIKCEKVYANDLSPTLIALHLAAKFSFNSIPENGSKEYWDRAYKEYRKILRQISPLYNLEDYQKMVDMPLYEIGAIEWYGSFSRGGFKKGYNKPLNNRDFYKESRKNHYLQAQNKNYKKIIFSQGDYRRIEIPSNAVIYADAPNKNGITYQIDGKFNHFDYYNWLREKSKTNPIFISEKEMPEDFTQIWEKESDIGRNRKIIEKLYFIDNRSDS